MIKLRPLAQQDIQESFEYYHQIRPKLGRKFERLLNRAFDLIETIPEVGGKVDNGIRAYKMKTFPYVVYYRVAGPFQHVYGVVHSSRQQTVWRERF